MFPEILSSSIIFLIALNCSKVVPDLFSSVIFFAGTPSFKSSSLITFDEVRPTGKIFFNLPCPPEEIICEFLFSFHNSAQTTTRKRSFKIPRCPDWFSPKVVRQRPSESLNNPPPKITMVFICLFILIINKKTAAPMCVREADVNSEGAKYRHLFHLVQGGNRIFPPS